MLPDKDGRHYFRPDNRQPLIARIPPTRESTARRIGGNTSDRDAGALPAPADLDSLFAFARAADVRVLYRTASSSGGSPTEDAQTVKYLMDRYADLIDCFSIGL